MIYYIVYKFIDIIFQVLYLALLIRLLISWFPHDRDHPIMRVIYNLTDPILSPFQNIIPAWKIGIDVSPILAFFALGILRNIIFQII